MHAEIFCEETFTILVAYFEMHKNEIDRELVDYEKCSLWNQVGGCIMCNSFNFSVKV